MAKAVRGAGKAERREPLLSRLFGNRVFLAVAAASIVALLTILAFYIRALPYQNYNLIYHRALSLGLGDKAKFAFIDANDPWIEYWLASYLRSHGIGSWTRLTTDNPDTHIFWYPWGRDFSHDEFPFIPVVGALAPGGLDTARWISLIPPIFGALMVPIAYIYIRRFYGELAGLTAALLLAILPASCSRTFAGFVEKIGIAMPFFIAGLALYSEALRRRSLPVAFAAGIAMGFIGFIWGGYAIAAILIAITSLLAPTAVEWRHAPAIARAGVAVGIGFLAILAVASRYGPASIKYGEAVLLGTLIPYIVVELLEIAGRRKVHGVAWRRPEAIYRIVAIALLVLGIAAAPALGVRGRALFAMAWPLRLAGEIHLSRLAETVAEHSSPLMSRGLFLTFVREGNIAALLAPVASLYLLYRSLRRREPEHLPLSLAALGLYYAVLGMLYFLQASSVVGILSVAALVGMLAPSGRSVPKRLARSKRLERSSYELRLAATIILVIIVLAAAVVGAKTAYAMMRSHIASITGYSVNVQQYDWLHMLKEIENATSKDTVIVAWWDYGYWISVGAHRPTLADGATTNATQIRLLAEFFTSTSEDEAVNILKALHLKPGKTLIFVHDNALYDPATGSLVYSIDARLPSIDIAKSWAMLHIAGKDEQGFEVGNSKYRQTLIYKMFASAPYHFDKVGEIYPQNLIHVKGKRITSVELFGEKTSPYSFKHFKPYRVILGLYMDSRGRPLAFAAGGHTYYFVQVLILYEWAG